MSRRGTSALLPAAGFGLPLLAVLGAILAYRPYFGLMDDALLLGFVGEVGDRGADAYADRVWGDIWGWGMVRPFYWGLAYLHYRAGAESEVALYVLNWVAAAACLFVAGIALARAFRVPAERRPLFLGAYGAAVFVFPWTLDLFAFVSLQEKWVVLTGALGLIWFAEPRPRLSPGVWYAVTAAVLVLGSVTKAQYLVFVPAYLLLLLDGRRRGEVTWTRIAYVFGLSAAIAVVLRLVAAHGSYTDDFGLGNVPTQLRNRYLWALGAAAIVWLAYLAVRWRRGERDTLLRDLIPVAIFAAYVVVFAQWQGYVFALLGFAAAGAFALAVTRLGSARLAYAVVVAAVVWAVVWGVVRTNELYGSLASIREFVRSPQALALTRQGEAVYVSCAEGADSFAAYIRRERGARLEVRPDAGVPWSQAKGSAPPGGFRFVLADARLCPAYLPGVEWRAVWRSSHSGGFALYRRD